MTTENEPSDKAAEIMGWQQGSGLPPATKVWKHFNHLSVIVGIENGRWHLSIAHPKRLPTWDELKDARSLFTPKDVFFCVPFPPESLWINIHNYCLHIWEIKDETLIDQWTFDGQAAKEYLAKGIITP